jgi:hypothetical protein
MRKYGDKEPSGAQRAYNRYVVPVTLITDAAPELILDLYRQRRQIEPVFKRLKSLFGYHELPVHAEQGAQAWFYGKLLSTAPCGTRVNKGRFPPLGEGTPDKAWSLWSEQRLMLKTFMTLRNSVPIQKENDSRRFIDCSSLCKRIWVLNPGRLKANVEL